MISDIAAALSAILQIWASFANKPPGWKPTMEDFNDLLSLVDPATPENEKALARERLGLPPVV